MPKKNMHQLRTSTTDKKIIGKITKEDQIKMIRGARRANDIAHGTSEIARGTGAWGGNKKQRARRERRAAQEEAIEYDED